MHNMPLVTCREDLCKSYFAWMLHSTLYHMACKTPKSIYTVTGLHLCMDVISI